jgi:hypothetical protein
VTSLVDFHSRSIRLLVAIALAILAGSVFLSLNLFSGGTYPRPLQVGDRWFYKVVFPDSTGYTLTEIVREKTQINGTETYVILNDDDLHISTNYLWLTSDWDEFRTTRPNIGNLNASSVTIFEPPIKLVHIPVHVGEKWEINSTAKTLTFVNNRTEVGVSEVQETRQVVSHELIRTPAGNFQAFKITVMSGITPFETLWFSSDLGQVVYGEYYNPIGEVVTQTLTGYNLNDGLRNSSSTYISPSASITYTSTGNAPQVISTTNSAITDELKISYE